MFARVLRKSLACLKDRLWKSCPCSVSVPASMDSSRHLPAILELLESRQLPAAFPAFHINFQPPHTPAPPGYLKDAGAAFGARGHGMRYGWNVPNPAHFDRNSPQSPDERYDTFICMGRGLAWSIAVPNGQYQVHIVAGDPASWDSTYRLRVENVPAIATTPTSRHPWAEATVMVTVTDGSLMISSDRDARNNKLSYVDITKVMDPPAAPKKFTAVVASEGRVDLQWRAPRGPVQSYVLERSRNGKTYSPIASLSSMTTRYSDTGLSEGKRYFYRLRALNAAGSSEAAALQVSTRLAAPTSLHAQPLANVPRIALQWSDNSAHEAGYIVERASNGTGFDEIARLGPNATAFSDRLLRPDTAYTYRVRPYGPAEGLAAMASARTTGFPVFEDTYFQNKPDLSAYGIERFFITSNGFFWKADQPGGGYDLDTPNEKATRNVARRVADANQILVIDIEHWPVDIRQATRAEVQGTLDKLMQIVDWIRDERPEVKLGFYGFGPLRDYRTPVNYWKALDNPDDAPSATNRPLFTAFYREWQAANDVLKPLMDKVDYLFPSLYTFYNNPKDWAYYAQGNIEEARRYGKPVLPFIWMDYHNSTELIGQRLSAEFWRLQLQTVRALADGLVIWGGVTYSRTAPPANQVWNEQDPWWLTTRQFLEST